jgi:hypothetical protein
MACGCQWVRSLGVCRPAHICVLRHWAVKSRHRSRSDRCRLESGVEHACAPARVLRTRSHRLHHMSYGFVRASCVSQSRGLVALRYMGPRRSVGVAVTAASRFVTFAALAATLLIFLVLLAITFFLLVEASWHLVEPAVGDFLSTVHDTTQYELLHLGLGVSGVSR